MQDLSGAHIDVPPVSTTRVSRGILPAGSGVTDVFYCVFHHWCPFLKIRGMMLLLRFLDCRGKCHAAVCRTLVLTTNVAYASVGPFLACSPLRSRSPMAWHHTRVSQHRCSNLVTVSRQPSPRLRTDNHRSSHLSSRLSHLPNKRTLLLSAGYGWICAGQGRRCASWQATPTEPAWCHVPLDTASRRLGRTASPRHSR